MALLREKEEALEAERQRLERMGEFLRSSIDKTELAQAVRPGEIRLEELPEAHCAVVKAPDFASEKFEEAVYFLHVRQLLAWARRTAAPPKLRGISSAGKAWRGTPSWRITTTARSRRGPPAGRPASIRRGPTRCSTTRVPTSPSPRPADGCGTGCRTRGYAIDGDLYEEDLVNYTASEDPQSFWLKLSLKVKL